MKSIKITGAREHNLKNISLEIPREKLVVITGLSGSGKSSLAFDTIYAEGQRRYVESLSAYARQFLGQLEKPDVDSIEGLSPAISIEQKTTARNPRSTVGTVTEIYDYLRLLFARLGEPHDLPEHVQGADREGRAAEPARLVGLGALEAVPGEGGVGGDDPVNPGVHRRGQRLAEIFRAQVGGELHQQGRGAWAAARRLIPGGAHGAEQGGEGGASLQAAKVGGVG